VRVVAGDEPGGKAAALNAAVRVAQGSYLVFTDTGQTFNRDTIRRLVSKLQENLDLGIVSGLLQTGTASERSTPGEIYWRYERWLRAWEARLHSSVGVTGAVYAMRRVDWVPLPPGLILDDLYVPMRAALRGYRIGFDDRAIATDTRLFAVKDDYRRKVRTLTGVLQLCAWLPAVLVPWRNPLWLQFACHKLLRMLTPYLLILCAVSGASLVGARLGTLTMPVAVGVVVTAVLAIAASRRAREAALFLALMNVAVIRATTNAACGEWNVWRR
jgi:cellulose synthase/poly-beta-1,6-N-acetylglucosamine synthase-like glycosyltransferase